MACGINQSGLCKRKADMDRYGPVMAKTCRCPAAIALIHCMSLSLDSVCFRGFGIVDPVYTDWPWVCIQLRIGAECIPCLLHSVVCLCSERPILSLCNLMRKNDQKCKSAAFGWNHFLLLAQVCETKRVDNCGGPEDLDERIESLGDKGEAYFCHGWTPCMCNYSIIIAPYHSKIEVDLSFSFLRAIVSLNLS